jgi:hypothetical protein
MLLAEQLALVAIDPESGRHALGAPDALTAALAGLPIVVALEHRTCTVGSSSG